MLAFMERMRDEAAAAIPSHPMHPMPPVALWRNRTRKQFKNTECGIFSMFFIVACARTDVPVKQIAERMIMNDDAMQTLRKVYFRPPTS